MDNIVLKKRLSTFRSDKGVITKVSDELLLDILTAWESWGGTAKEFYTGLGLSKMQLGGLMQKAKKLRREGHPHGDFREIKVSDINSADSNPLPPCAGIEVAWGNGKLIRFNQVEQLVEFLNKVA